MEICVTAPNRVDLAGGTTDLYPLYLLMESGFTVNVAITVHSRVVLRSSRKPGITVISEDLRESVYAADSSSFPSEGPLALVCRAVGVLPPPEPVEILTWNRAPRGSGLGASSALLVALIVGLLRIREQEMAPEKIIDLACSIETSVIGVPAGKQDYIAAFYGDISLLEFGYHGFSRRTVASDRQVHDRLEKMLVLSYTGESRFSGMNNWEMTKAFVERRNQVREKLIRIRDLARQVGESVRTGVLGDLPGLIDEEWQLRASLAQGVTTPGVEAIIKAAREAGALASKICGAGGGGCMITLADPERRERVEQAILQAGGEPMRFKIDRKGSVLS